MWGPRPVNAFWGRASLGVIGALSPWVEQSPPTYLLASGVVVLGNGNLLDWLSDASWSEFMVEMM